MIALVDKCQKGFILCAEVENKISDMVGKEVVRVCFMMI